MAIDYDEVTHGSTYVDVDAGQQNSLVHGKQAHREYVSWLREREREREQTPRTAALRGSPRGLRRAARVLYRSDTGRLIS